VEFAFVLVRIEVLLGTYRYRDLFSTSTWKDESQTAGFPGFGILGGSKASLVAAILANNMRTRIGGFGSLWRPARRVKGTSKMRRCRWWVNP
jgi:hypothetical protein